MPLKILYTGLQKENYNPRRGYSFEYHNFYLTLKSMPGVEVIEHPFDLILWIGKEKFNERLLEIVKSEKPDLLFAFMYTDELDSRILDYIKDHTSTKTIAWFADDYWRFFNYSRRWAPHFTWVVTTYSKAVDWYRRAGHSNVIKSQWACNTALYKPIDKKVIPHRDIEVSFVGQYKLQRGKLIKALRASGIRVEAFGYGWPNGKVTHEEMIRVFARSKINLNLNVRPGLLSLKVLARVFLKKSMDNVVLDLHFIQNLRAYLHFKVPHTHARPFEIAGCRAFVISGRSDDIGACYEEGKEMAFYSSPQDLIQKIKYYLSRDEEREHIAEAGYKRTLRDHVYENRFHKIFKIVGLEK